MAVMLVQYLFATNEPLPAQEAALYEYIFARNGVFKRASRAEISARIPIGECRISGLAQIAPEIKTHFARVPERIVRQMLTAATEAAREDLEILFYLMLEDGKWRLEIPAQQQRYDSVTPIEKGRGSPYERALIEIHSHHRMPAAFSPDDDRDETGFRLYGVLGSLRPELSSWPQINFRVGVYGSWWPLPADQIIEMPSGLIDYHAKA